MKTVHSQDVVVLPKGVTAQVKNRTVRIMGPRGELRRQFSHLNIDVQLVRDKRAVQVELWFGNRKELACVRTVCSHIQNMIDGVTKGYRCKMKFVYAHFPINVNITDNNERIEIRNFIGERVVRSVPMLGGVKVDRDPKVKDQIILEGNSVDNVTQSAAQVHQSCLVRNKDIRKFLDGIYVCEKGFIEE